MLFLLYDDRLVILVIPMCSDMVLLVSGFDFIHPPRSIASLLFVALFTVDTIDAYIYCTH